MSTALVIGLGKSGLAAARLLLAQGHAVRGFDQRPEIEGLPGDLAPFLGEALPPRAAFDRIDTMVLSPGVPPAAFRELCKRWAPRAEVTGELALALRSLPDARPVLITGTNGKSTVTALLGELLRAEGRNPFVGGNLGVPLSEHVLQGRDVDGFVLECSSYQLETLPPTPSAAGVVLNVTPDHLDRYDSMYDYAQTKARVFAGLGAEDLAVLDAEDSFTPELAPARGRVVRVGEAAACVRRDGLIVFDDPPYPRELLRLPGRHNAKNAVFALVVARHLGIGPDACARGLAAFEGLPHRMAFVRELDGVRYYNDSKATNVASAVATLAGLAEPFVLIAGGQEKGDDLGALGEVLRAQGRGLVAMGSSADKFLALAGEVRAEKAASMGEAAAAARRMARPGDVVVLAPACASFDQFRSFAHRGEAFTEAVEGL